MRASPELESHWAEWTPKIPYLHFPFDWHVRALPPFGGALIRYDIRLYAGPGESPRYVSIYLDVNDSLGSMGEPYWEIYSNADDETSRHMMNDTDDLLREIYDILNNVKNPYNTKETTHD